MREVLYLPATEALHITTVNSNGEGYIVTPQKNYNGWVNPEDLAPMPQCIAQQDQSTWLSTMTKCTSKRCTSHFGVICTHHQWLTQLSCLSIGFSPDIIEGYLPYCGRSVLAKAQLYLWIHNITGRTWLVDVGDANGLQNLSPASLAKGYAAVNVIYNAPTCLTDSVSAQSMEPFQHVMASCSFTSITQHTGNAARPWEYSESLRSMIALDFETVGYDLAQRSISYGDYFDKECFCSAFTIDPKREPCSGLGQIDLTKERLWINATCGSTSLPDNWTDALKTTEFACIPIEDWHWPMCVADMTRQVIELTDQCATDACELDSSGYCKVKRAVDRACFCRDFGYDSCGGSCQIFETRIDYIKWLHDLCGNVQDWHGLPDDWRQLAAPTPLDMIPWRWTIKPSNDSNIAYINHLGSIRATETCASNEWKLGSFALVNIATFLAAFLSQGTGIHRIPRGSLWHPHSWCWFFKGTFIAALQLLANWFNVFLIQNTPGYEDIPVVQLMLLWCSIPRLAWLTILLIGVQPFEAMNFSAAASSLFAEMILQFLSLYYMAMTVNYGREHDFYLGGMERAERRLPAKFMYAGALMWLIIITMALVQLIRATRRMNRLAASSSLDLPKWQRGKQTTSNIVEELMAQSNERCARLMEKFAYYWMDKSRGAEESLLTSSEGGDYTVYGTFSAKGQNNWVSQKASVELYAATVISMFLLWIAQWFFWGGFIGLSSEEFCPPKLGVLTAVWVAFSLAGATVGAT
ncbi:hypothetical protein B0O99DRAFT_649498 [Bisporella sp. PMI_857]|nr:hypothetical protein B0O99DRAFT_649498 [Bisporella sp. PMI_857]